MESEKRLEKIPGLEDDAWVVIKKFSYRESSKMTEFLNLTVDGGQRNSKKTVNLNLYDMRMKQLVFGIKSASFLPEGTSMEKKEQIVGDLPADAGGFLYSEIDMFNGQMRDEEFEKK